jgi:Flp pilus assembly protein TadD
MFVKLLARRSGTGALAEAYAAGRAGDWTRAVQSARAAVAATPGNARASYVLGASLVQLARQTHAEAARRAGNAPAPIAALYQEATRHLEQAERRAGAELAFKAALERGIALRESGDLEAAHGAFETAHRLRPDDPRAHRELASSWHSLGDNAQAIQAYRAIVQRNPNDPTAHAELAQCLLSEGEFAEGWEEYEWRLQAPDAAAARVFPFPAWGGEPLEGRTLLVRSEQGVGDEVMFASCLPDVIAANGHCVVECSRRLAPLFRRSFPLATVLSRDLAKPPDWSSVPRIDLQVMAGSLPRHFRRRPEDFPGRRYLTADPAAVAAWRERLGGIGRRLIGVAWSGGLPTTLRAARSLALEQLAPLFDVPDVRFVSLEIFDREVEIAGLRQRHGVDMIACKGLGGDLDELAAAVAALDLVITVPTAVAHIAGALGTPAWVLVPRVATWRYLRSGEGMPWYGTVRVFRRAADLSTEAFLANVRGELDRRLAS